MTIEKGSKVKLQYEGKLETGEVFDSSNKTGEEVPLEFVAGEGHVIKGFDDAVLGMQEGEEKSFEINPEDAYGERREEMKQEIPKSALPQDKTPEKGMMLMMSSPQGQQFPARIEDVKEDSIIIDLNHPLAGKKLLFKVKVVGIESTEDAPATASA
ncbi:MAG: peptidylprolyl isomerase [Candidatus Pacearchaeota archaeon]